VGDHGGDGDLLSMRELVLKYLFRVFPFNLQGDCKFLDSTAKVKISCVINFYGRLDLLSGILYSLVSQDYPKSKFEVILIEDQGGTDGGRRIAEEFGQQLNIIYMPLDTNFGNMGYSRNFGLKHSRGEIILFLDDDTVILQQEFLANLDCLFVANAPIDAIVPHGHAAFTLVAGHYSFHDPYFMTSRCTAYRRNVLMELAGFMDHFVGQEDVEFVVRFTLAGKTALNVASLDYFHPPLLVPNFRKPKAVGNSFYRLRSRYPLLLWLLVLLNCSRHAPLYLLPGRKFREMGRFGIGFLLGVIISPFNKKGFRYG